MVVISIYNVKGGVAKTTSSIHLSSAIKVLLPNSRVLLVDMDGQYSLKTYFKLRLDRGNTNCDVLDYILGEDISSCTVKIDFTANNQKHTIDVLPSSARMGQFEDKHHSLMGKENLLAVRNEEANLQSLYDFVIIDCPPAFNLNTINALLASDYLVIPANMDDYARSALPFIEGNLQIMERNLKKSPRILGVLPTMYDKRQSVMQHQLMKLKQDFQHINFFRPIRLNAAFRKAQLQRTVVYQSETSPFKGTEDYLTFSRELIESIRMSQKSSTVRKKSSKKEIPINAEI